MITTKEILSRKWCRFRGALSLELTKTMMMDLVATWGQQLTLTTTFDISIRFGVKDINTFLLYIKDQNKTTPVH